MAKAKPKLDWLSDARAELNNDEGYRKLGSTDVVLGLSLGDESRLVKFEAFEVGEINEDVDLRDADLVLAMTPKNWNAYLRLRAQGKGPSLLTLDLDEGVVGSRSPLTRIKFERYNLSIQAFIDAGARLAA
jgi:hypothetical protein